MAVQEEQRAAQQEAVLADMRRIISRLLEQRCSRYGTSMAVRRSARQSCWRGCPVRPVTCWSAALLRGYGLGIEYREGGAVMITLLDPEPGSA